MWKQALKFLFFSSIGIKTVLLFMMYVAIEWSDLVLYPVSFPLNVCMGGNEPGNIGRFKPLTSGA